MPSQVYTADEAAMLLTEATRRIAANPGVEQAAVANCLPANPSVGPLTGRCDYVQMRIRNEQESADDGHDVWMNMVGEGYFSTLGIAIFAGRPFDEGDRAGAPRVAIVTQSAADRYWPGRDPLGESIRLSAGSDDWAQSEGGSKLSELTEVAMIP